MLTTKEVADYFKMFEPVVKARWQPAVYISFAIMNPSDSPAESEPFTLQQDLIHIIGIIDIEGRMYEVRVIDPYEFTQEKSIISAEEVLKFRMRERFALDVRSGKVVYSQQE
jgi:hypothetical protein